MHRLALDNESLSVDVLTWGATIRGVQLKGLEEATEVVLGYPSLDDYERDRFFLGAVVGRYANTSARAGSPSTGRSIGARATTLATRSAEDRRASTARSGRWQRPIPEAGQA